MPGGQTTYYKTDYAYPCDSYINTLLGTYLVRKALQKTAEKYYSDEAEKLHQGSTLVTSQNYPQLHATYEKCIDRLKSSERRPLYVTSQLIGINALSIELRGEQMILISRQAVAQLSEEELLFVLGHELGHCQYGHIICHTVLGLLNDMNKASEVLGPLLTDTIEVPLVKWFHCSEFTADRAGLICCQSLQTAHEIFCRLGMNDTRADAYVHYKEVSSPHPLLQTRWEMLQKYANDVRQ